MIRPPPPLAEHSSATTDGNPRETIACAIDGTSVFASIARQAIQATIG